MAATLVIAQDPFGNTLALQHETRVAAMAGFVDSFVGYRPGILACSTSIRTTTPRR